MNHSVLIQCQTWWGNVMTRTCWAASGISPLVFPDDVTADSPIQPSAAKPVHMVHDPKHTAKTAREFLKARKVYFSVATWSQPNNTCFSAIKYTNEGRDPMLRHGTLAGRIWTHMQTRGDWHELRKTALLLGSLTRYKSRLRLCRAITPQSSDTQGNTLPVTVPGALCQATTFLLFRSPPHSVCVLIGVLCTCFCGRDLT